MRPTVRDKIRHGYIGQLVEPVDGVEAGGEVNGSGRKQRFVKRATHRTGINSSGKAAGAPGFLQIGEQLIEVVAGQVAENRLKWLPGAPSEPMGNRPHQTDGIATFRGA